jgi:prepilin-type N-terminal cleavage/methylation domain-containing protein
MRNSRGFTLVELMISASIMVVAVAATCAILLEAMHLTRNSEEVAQSNDAARLATEFVLHGIRLAGAGASGGVYVNNPPTLTNAVFGIDNGFGGTDELWLIVPDKDLHRPACTPTAPGAAIPLITEGTGTLNLACPAAFPRGGMLLVSNMTTSALATQIDYGTPTSITYAESGAAFSNRGSLGYQRSDLVYPVSLFHYFVATNPTTNRSALYRCIGKLGSGVNGGPFIDDTTNCMMIQNDIEDFQLAYGLDRTASGNPDNYTFVTGCAASPCDATNTLAPAYTPFLRSVRVSVVALGRRKMLDANGSVLTSANYAPFAAVENHTIASPTADGYRRSLYTRRVELPNLLPSSL